MHISHLSLIWVVNTTRFIGFLFDVNSQLCEKNQDLNISTAIFVYLNAIYTNQSNVNWLKYERNSFHFLKIKIVSRSGLVTVSIRHQMSHLECGLLNETQLDTTKMETLKRKTCECFELKLIYLIWTFFTKYSERSEILPSLFLENKFRNQALCRLSFLND